MNRARVLTTQQADAWLQALECCKPYDFYHLPQYHHLAEKSGDGIARLFHYAEGDYVIVLPVLFRSLNDVLRSRPGRSLGLVTGKEQEDEHQCDVTSVYGYAGPVSSHPDMPDTVVKGFQRALHSWLQTERAVTAFARLHPLIAQTPLLQGLGDCKVLSKTVSIDLTLPLDVQKSRFRKNHKIGINKLRREGLVCCHDQDRKFLDAFIRIYYETMTRVGARPGLFFSTQYFHDLMDGLGPRAHLFVCMLQDQVLSGGIFVECQGILQYHLGGTLSHALKLAPMKLLVDEVRLWATQRGLHTFHLGGGTTSQPDDSLLHFKAGFSDRTHDFQVWRWILSPEAYQRVCEQKARWNVCNGLQTTMNDYFPAYRCPTVAVQS